MDIISLILTLGIISGQLVKLPVINLGVTTLDIVVVIICTWGLINSKFNLKNPPLFIKSALFFILVTIISLMLSPLNLNPIQKLSSFAYSIRLLDFILLGWLIQSGAFEEMKKNITHIIIYSGFILAIAGILQLIFIPDLGFLSNNGWDPHYFRTASTFLDPNFLGAYFALSLLLLLRHSREGGNLNKLGFTLIYLALLFTFSRGAYLMFAVSFAIFSLLNKSIKLASVTILLSLGLFIGFTIYNHTIAAPRNIDRTQSAEYRLDSWQQGVAIFQEHLSLGIGYNAYRYALSEYNLADENFLKSRGASSNDSSFLFVSATTGVVGLISFLLFLSLTMWNGFKQKNYVLVAGLIGLITQSFFANTLFYPFLLIWIILISSFSKSEIKSHL